MKKAIINSRIRGMVASVPLEVYAVLGKDKNRVALIKAKRTESSLYLWVSQYGNFNELDFTETCRGGGYDKLGKAMEGHTVANVFLSNNWQQDLRKAGFVIEQYA